MTGLRALSIEQAVLPTADWLEQAACRSVDPELFFDTGQDLITMTKGTLSRENHEKRAAAKAVCSRCPVMMKCREHFIDETHGVYGGLDKDQRKTLREAKHIITKTQLDADLIGREAFDLFIAGEPLTALAKKYGLRTRQLTAYLDTYLGSPDGLRARLEHEVRKAYEQGLTDEETAISLGITLAKLTFVKRKLGLVTRVVSQRPAKLSQQTSWDSAAIVMGTTLQANYLGESADGWLFMQVKYPHASTRKWMRPEDVSLGKGVRRHVISKGVGSGQKRKRAGEDPAEVA